ncbi:glycosyltransferase [Niabella drilacis]|uniref:Glycosyltransferase involved in cell wall bisynthesis n=1 Tax=Niabella drilacis (strain DSM 25811 / CCM 8410 / CCUG 62505 / LMG 26954 / E90) TaxID=1285928 RepID=A0A1G6NRJ0_NIADE|nr:glycosyltransferase [Niabella drilacis]SDC70523.1 Glycosyltransferase involved in cell wall bisynthesis [Niabella drilacis]
MPKILRIHNRLITGGPVYNVLNLTKFLEPDFETLLVVGEKEHHEQDAGFIAERMGIRPLLVPEMGRAVHPLKDYKAYHKITEIIKWFKPDIVHTHAAKPGAVGRLAAYHMKVPVVVHTYHGHVFHSYFNKAKTQVFLNIERYLAKKSTALIAISPEQKTELSHQYRVAKENKFRIVPLGFELERFMENQEEKRKAFRTEFGLADDEIAIGITGRLVPVKNHDLFLEALAFVLKHTAKKVKAFIIGDGTSCPHIQEKAAALHIPFGRSGEACGDRSLIFTSWRSDMDVVNAGLDIVCLTSFNEGTPVSLIEAQAANKPIVSTNVGGVKDVVKEGTTALLAGIQDKQTFFDHLLTLVNDDEWRAAMGNSSTGFITARFGVKRLASDFRDLYYSLLSGKTQLQRTYPAFPEPLREVPMHHNSV